MPSARGALFVRTILLVAALCLMARPLLAHAILLESSPAANAKISGPDAAIKLRFNVRIDLGRSRLLLVRPDGTQTPLTIKKDMQPDIIAADAAGLTPGDYRIRWQVLASDGHITRGEVLFRVASV
jgi:methionine-rich copper-binding protein CopC